MSEKHGMGMSCRAGDWLDDGNNSTKSRLCLKHLLVTVWVCCQCIVFVLHLCLYSVLLPQTCVRSAIAWTVRLLTGAAV